jgi:hypothetical protein
MARFRLATILLPLIGLFVLTGHFTPARAQQQPARQQPTANGKLSAVALSARIDQYITARYRKEGVNPTTAADDATFYRRAHLDLAGKIPNILEIRDFLDDDRADKRKIWVDKLLDSDDFAEHFSNVYRQMMLPQIDNQEAIFAIGGFENWLRKKFRDNVPYDKMVYELLTANVQPGAGFRGDGEFTSASPAAFYASNEYKPENLAGAAARLFLGVKIECAQCHKHPFADWTREQFWQFAVFFTKVNPNMAGQVEVDDEGNPIPKQPQPGAGNLEPQITIPKTDQVVKARFLDGKSPNWAGGADPRKVLAEWITAPNNPYFARIAVNQLWHYFFGTGLVDPFDDFGDHNPASHPELVDELADQFVKNGYDLKYLVSAIINSKTYQLDSKPQAAKKDDEPESPRLFTRMPLRALTGEQLFDSLAEVMEYKIDRTRQPFGNASTPREEFLAKFNNPENKRVDTHTSILQALHLMNGKFMATATNMEKNRSLATVAASPAAIPDKIDTLYMVTLARPPRPNELEVMTKYVTSGGPHHDQVQALGDVMWVLLNSAEFSLNH